MRTARQLLIVPVALALAALAACTPAQPGPTVDSLTSTGATSTTTATVDPATAQHKYYQCLQQQGIDIQEPQGNGSGSDLSTVAPGTDQAKLQKATEQCRQFLPNGGVAPTIDSKQLADRLRQAKCMREHGINVPDPTPGQQTGPVEAPPGVTPDEYGKAFKACVQAGAGK